jgi:chorismate-pyruvate lyase
MTTNLLTALEGDIALAEPVQRLLLTTDGTLTDLLEAINLEKTRLVLLEQKIGPAERSIDSLGLTAGEPLLARKVLLQGEQTGETYVYAESVIALARLDERIRQGLLTTNTPLGHLWKKNRTETFKEVLHSGIEFAGELSSYFGINPEAPLLVRKCRVSSGGRPVTLITEHVWCAVT